MKKILKLSVYVVVSFFATNFSSATIYYSQGNASNSFADLANWNSSADGSGSQPLLVDFNNGLHTFLVQDNHTVSIDLDLDVVSLIVGQGGATSVLDVDGASARSITVRTSIYIDSNGDFRPSNTNTVHSITLAGTNTTITNLGIFRPYRDADSYANFIISSTGSVNLAGTSQIWFNDLTINGGGTITSSGTIYCFNNLLITGNSTLIGSANIYNRGAATVDVGATVDVTNGAFVFDENTDQNLTCNGTCDFYNLYFDNRANTADIIKTVVGDISVKQRLYVYSDAVFAGTGSVTLKDNLDIRNPNGWIGSGDIIFNDPFDGGYINTVGNTVTLGTSRLIVDAYISLSDNNTALLINNDLIITDGNRLVLNFSNTIQQATGPANTLTLGASSLLYARGIDNFPSGFLTYALDETSRTIYDGTFFINNVRGGIDYGDLVLNNGTKNNTGGAITVNGNLTINNATNFSLINSGDDLTLKGDVNGNGGTLSSTQVVTIAGVDKNQTLDPDVTYDLNDLVITNPGPITDIRTKNIRNDISLSGDLSIINTDGNASNYLIVDINENDINSSSGVLTINDWVEFRTGGETAFEDMVDETAPSFASVSISNNSVINFDGTTTQEIPGLTYGNIYLDNGTSKTLTGDIIINGNMDGNRDNYDLIDAGFTITLFGNWDMGDFGNGQNRTVFTGDFIFAGGNQTSKESNFNNVTFSGTGTKTMTYTINVACTMTIEDGVTFTSDYNVEVGCDLIVNGTGILRHNNRIFTFDGTVDQNITINDPTNSFLNDVSLTNNGNVISLNSDLDVNGYFTMNNGNAVTFNMDDDSLYIVGDFLMYAEDNLSMVNGTLIFDGNADQIIRNGNASTSYNNMYFRTGGEKRFSTNNTDINGDVIGDASVTINQNNTTLHVAGDWTHLGSIAGGTGNRIYFDGPTQTIIGSEFNTVYFGGSGSCVLGANTYIKGDLYIENGGVLDVDAIENNQITLEGNWINDLGGVFEARNGRVIFIGSNSNIFTGGTGAGKSFYDLRISLNSNGFSITIQDRNPDIVDSGIDLDIDNDLVILKGRLNTSDRDVYVGNNLYVGSNGRFVGSNGNHALYFDGPAGTKFWRPSNQDTYRSVFFNSVGSVWELNDDVNISGGENINIDNGKFDLTSYDLTFVGSNSDVNINGVNAELKIGAAAVLTMGTNTNCDLNNNGGTLTVIGNSSNVAKIKSASTFNYFQTGATSVISAEYYSISGTRGNGMDISDGIIDGTHNFSNGSFSGGVGTAYLTIHSGAFATDTTIRKITFTESSNGVPTYNVSHTSGSVITFEDAKGNAVGPSREDDDGNAATGFIRWNYTEGFFWTNGGGDSNWDNPLNWSTGVLPISTSQVILDHTTVSGAYTVNINTAINVLDATTGSLDILDGASGKITLNVGGKPLRISGDVAIGSINEIRQSSSTDTLFVSGSFSNTSGILNAGTATVVFDGVEGDYIISTNSGSSANRDFNDVIFRGGANYTLADILEVEGDLEIKGGTLNLGDANNRLELLGDFIISDSGAFVHANAEVRFEGTSGTQVIDFGGQSAYDIDFRNSSLKQINANLSLEDDFVLQASSGDVSAGENFIFIQGDWRNLKGATAFTQTGGGTVSFNGVNNQNIGVNGDPATQFNNLLIQSLGTKSVNSNLSLTGDLQILMGSPNALIEINPGFSINGVGPDNRITMQDGILRLESTVGFPTGFEDVDLLGGEVRYETNGIDQDIYGVSYYDLRLWERGGTNRNKNALGDIVVRNNFINANSDRVQLKMNCFDLTINGSMNIAASAPQIDWGSTCITTCGTGGTLVLGENITTIDADLNSFHNIRIENGGNVELRLLSDLTLEGDLIVSDGSRFDMQSYTVKNTCTDIVNPTIFTLNDNSNLQTQVAAGFSAFPSDFGTYFVSNSSLVEYQRSGNQDVFTNSGALIYGGLDLQGDGTKTLDGDLFVEGDFDMDGNSTTLVDNGNNMSFSGPLAVFNNYTATSGVLVKFDGGDQTIRIDDNSNVVNFDEVQFSGIGTKLFWDGEDYNFGGDFKVDENAIIDFSTYRQNISFLGDSILIDGTLTNDDGNTLFRFNKNGVQVVDFGANHDINHLEIKTNAQVKIINNGLNITGNGGSQNFLEVETGATLDLGSLTHLIGQDNFIIDGTLLATNANLVFNQDGTQNIDGFDAQDVLFTGSNDKNMDGIWRMNNMTVDGAVRIDFDGEDTLVIRGSLISQGDFNREDGVVQFEINNSDLRTIQSNNAVFSQVKFNQVGSNEAIYSLVDDLNIDDSLRIGTGATLDINGKTLFIGAPADGGASTEYLVIESGAELQLDEGASLLFDCNGNDPVMDVFGTLTLLGSSSETAVISRYSGNNEIDINVIGGNIAARYYSISNLVNAGLYIDENATIDPVNNFSDGSFTGMQEGVGAVYLHIEADVSAVGDIGNIAFSNNNPVVGNDFNVRRTRTDGGILTFVDNVNGALAGFEYEDETAGPGLGGRIVWPANTITNWVGGDPAGVNDWFVSGNWDNGVPDITKTAIIKSRPFLPIIELTAESSDTAFAKNLRLSANAVSLNIRDGLDLKVLGEIQLGTGNLSTSIVVEDDSSDILVGESWFITNNSSFSNGGAKVEFLGLSSPVSIDHDDQSFHNVVFSGSATYNIVGDLDINGDLSINGGTISPATNGYVYTVAGDWNDLSGAFSTSTNGTVDFDGVDQIITNGVFDNLTISSSGCASVSGLLTINDELIVNGCLQAQVGSSIDMNDDVTINATGSFDDGGESHTFSGVNWIGTGAFPLNAGTITFDRNGGSQNIFNAKFNRLAFTGSSRINLEGDVSVTSDVNISNSINRFYTQQHVLNNTTGVGTFTLENNEFIYVDGANNFPSGFANYSIGETSSTYYDGTGNQIILGGISYGNLYLQGLSTKTIALGDVGVKRDLIITDATLDVSSNNYNISIGRNWYNDAGGSFIAQKGKVIFNGNVNQRINPGEHPIDGNKKFWDLEVSNTSSNVDVDGADIYIDSTLSVTDGLFTLAGVGNGFTAFVGGSLEATGSGIFATAGVYELNSSVNSSLSSDLSIRGNGSIFADLKVNATSNTVYNLTSDLIVNGDFNLMGGKVKLDGFTANLGTNINDAVTVNGDLVLNEGSELLLGNQTSLTVTPAGSFEIIGTISNPATVTRRYNNGDYNFVVNGSIGAQYYAFRYMSSQGIVINNTATIDNVNNFSNGTFSNPSTGGVCLRVENTQKFTTANGSRIENVSFPTNPGSGTINVAKTVSSADTIEFYSATGTLSGENYENDPNDLILWTGPRKMIWTGNKNTDWFDVANWSATSGPTQVPDSLLDAIIPFVTNQPIINASGAMCQKLTIESSAIVIISTSDDTGSDLVVYDNLLIEGVIRTNTDNDILEVRGDWSRVDGGIYTYGSAGKVILSSTSGTLTLDNGTSPFYNLDIDAVGNIVLLGTDIVVDNDIRILNGTLDVSNNGFDISVEGDFINNGTFRARTGSVNFTTLTTSNLDGSTTDFYDVEMSGTGVLLVGSDIQVDNITTVSAGTIELNGNSWYVGNAIGSDLLRVNGGTFIADAGSEVRIANGGGIIVSTGGLFKLLGDDLSNRATLTNQSGSTKYSFTIANGGTLEARYYTIKNLNVSGLNFQSGSVLDLTNNLSYGTFTDGTPAGTYITFSNTQNLIGNDQIEYVEFLLNPGGGASNVRKSNGAGKIKFYFAIGVFQGEEFDNDPLGLVEWDADLIWTGLGGSSSWIDPNNWTPQLNVVIPDLIPTSITDVIIPDASTTPFDPVLVVDGLADDLLIQTGGLLTINSNAGLTVADSIIVEGVLTIDNSSMTEIKLGGSWLSTLGTFNSGNNSEIVFTNATGVQSISSNHPFCGITISSSTPSNGTIETGTILDINCDLNINAGTFRVADPSHTINLSGNWINNRVTANVGFEAGTGSVVLDGTSDQNISQFGGSDTFYNLTVSNTGASKVSLLTDLIINNNLTISDNSVLDAQSRTLSILGDWVNNNTVASAGFNENTGNVNFSSSTLQTITHAGGKETFNNVTLNNSAIGTALLLNNDVEISGLFIQTDGIVSTGINRLILSNTLPSSYSGWSSSTFVEGNLRRFIASNTSTYQFPIAKGTAATDYFRIDVLNNNMTGLNYIDGSVDGITESGNNVDGNVFLEEYNGGATYLAVTGEQAIWTLTPDAPIGTGSYGIRAYIANITGLSDNLFALVKRPTASTDYADWDDDGENTTVPDTGTAGRTIASGYAERLGWTGFSQFAIATTDIPLPIQLLSFDVEAIGSSVNITWVTLTEKNNEYFTIERSVDGVNFIPVGKVFSKGNSLSEVPYEFIDSKAVSGLSYYRLKQTDLDGKSQTFEIRAVFVQLGGFSNIYPNPTSGEIYVGSAKNDIKSVSIYSSLGELVLTQSLNGENVKLDVSKLASGVYTIVTSGIIWVEKEVLIITK